MTFYVCMHLEMKIRQAETQTEVKNIGYTRLHAAVEYMCYGSGWEIV